MSDRPEIRKLDQSRPYDNWDDHAVTQLVTSFCLSAESGWGREGGDKTRETRERWPLLTVETEVNGDSKEWDPSSVSVGSLGLTCRYKIFFLP